MPTFCPTGGSFQSWKICCPQRSKTIAGDTSRPRSTSEKYSTQAVTKTLLPREWWEGLLLLFPSWRSELGTQKRHPSLHCLQHTGITAPVSDETVADCERLGYGALLFVQVAEGVVGTGIG